MDALMLLSKARAAQLRIKAVEGRLVIHGPRRAESLAKELLAHKDTVLAALDGSIVIPSLPADPTPVPTPCSTCSGSLYWRRMGERTLHCQSCEPYPLSEVVRPGTQRRPVTILLPS